MYGYSFDCETGGLILNDKAGQTSLEPRPVYAPEMDLLGFDSFWHYEKQSEVPILWAEAENYTYGRLGKRIARTRGGKLTERPILEPLVDRETGERVLPDGETLQPVDLVAMNEKNAMLLTALGQSAEKRIFDVFRRYEKKLDGFHVAFSGGKDSIVLLDLVKRALPASRFVVIFGDTGMEFPDTYALVDKVEAQCRADGIAFHRAASHLKPEESWRLFGPPSRVLRWCCSVHKAAPQTMKLREIFHKNDFVGMDFVGVRAEESASRAEYDVENFGKKQRGQYSHNSILEWTSAEVWTYLFWRNLPVNDAYKKGNSRAGCLFCPLGSGGKADWFRGKCYPDEVGRFLSLIHETIDDPKIDTYISNGGWVERRNGRDIVGNIRNYMETDEAGGVSIHIPHPKTDWREWIKTVGDDGIAVKVNETPNGIVAHVPATLLKTLAGKRIRAVFHKVSTCVGCGVCEANCRQGAISFKGGLHIANCIHCGQCHEIDAGCINFDSRKYPVEEGKKAMSLNTFADHAPKPDWISGLINKASDIKSIDLFLIETLGLGPVQKTKFKRFLVDAGLISKKATTDVVQKLSSVGWDSALGWGLILVNLVANNPQMRWYVDNLPTGIVITGKEVEEMLQAMEVTAKDASSIRKSFKRLVELPLGTKLNWGFYREEGRGNATMGRTPCRLSQDDRVAVLYSLYMFAEKCGDMKQFTLSRLMDESVQSEGVSPAKLFGFDRETMRTFLNGLGEAHPDFISATFTHDLEKITLRDDKTSVDVLGLLG